jgi:gamma-glutamyl:cysteine ligase YbdK (ATP-grasp superfamily)
MGDEVSKRRFSEKDNRRFQRKLALEMDYVRQLFAEQRFDNRQRKLGYELELCLLDEDGRPAPLNDKVLKSADNELFTYELARFNLEINGNFFAVGPRVFQHIDEDMSSLYSAVEQACERFDIQPGLFGVLPSLNLQHLDPQQYMSDMYRYRLLDQRLMDMRQRPIQLDIRGADHLKVKKNDVMLEALGTSLQIHYQVPFDEAVDSYHASLWASMAVLAVSANSPLVLGKACWQESRIAIFKQAVDTRNPTEIDAAVTPRVHLARGYIHSWLDLFEHNNVYSPILPEVLDSEVSALHHFNLHNGTIWRWVRPILGVDKDDTYHLRVELRVAPSGPTLIDTMANIVFNIGLIEGLKQTPKDLTRVPYKQLERDFYEVARTGLEAHIHWCSGETGVMRELLRRDIIPLARTGLQKLGIKDAEAWMQIIEQRVQNSQTGASWMLDFWTKHADAEALVSCYLKHARSNTPVHLWPLK